MAEKIIHYGTFGKQSRKKSSDPKTKVVYKKGSPWWRRSTAILVLLFLGGNAVFFKLIEESIKMEGENLTVSLELGDTERKIFCRGSGMIGLDIDGC